MSFWPKKHQKSGVIVFCGSKIKEIMTDLPFSKVLKVLFQDRYSAIGDLTASNGNNWKWRGTSQSNYLVHKWSLMIKFENTNMPMLLLGTTSMYMPKMNSISAFLKGFSRSPVLNKENLLIYFIYYFYKDPIDLQFWIKNIH